MWSLNSIQLVDIFGGVFVVQPLQDFDLMVEGTKTHANLSHELHWQLKGDEILIDEIPKLDTWLDLFFGGIFLCSLVEVAKISWPHEMSFLVQPSLFPTVYPY